VATLLYYQRLRLLLLVADEIDDLIAIAYKTVCTVEAAVWRDVITQ
jgi:hypothetical protein